MDTSRSTATTPHSVYARWRRPFAAGGALVGVLVVLDTWPGTQTLRHILDPATVVTAGGLTAGHVYATTASIIRQLRKKVVIIDFRDDLDLHAFDRPTK